MRTMGIAGWSGCGKTRLLVALLPILKGMGLRVSTLKHAHHGFDPARKGGDSHRHREAGAFEAMVATPTGWSLGRAFREEPEPPFEALVARMAPVDLILAEGFKAHPHPKVEVHRPSLGQPLLAAEDPWILAVASDAVLPGLGVPLLDLDDPRAIAAFILDATGLASA